MDGRIPYAFRTLRRQPTFALVSVLTLALGIGANTAIFSVIKTVVLNPLPYEAPEKIAVLWEVNPDGNQGPVSVPTFEDWKREAKTLESLAAYRHVDFSFKGTAIRRTCRACGRRRISSTSSRATRRSDARSRADESVVGADRVVVLSHGFWSRALGADASIVGRTIQLDSVPYTVVGVMPPVFEFPTSTDVEVWTPLAFDPKDMHGRSRRARMLTVVGRIARRLDASTGAARSQRDRGPHRDANSKTATPDGARASWPAHEQLVGASRPALMVLMGAVGFLLLIVCANMANLLLARLSSRRREMAVRGALGASRWEVARPVLAESLLLSFAGGALGSFGAVVGLRMLGTMKEAQLPRMDRSSSMAACCCSRIVISIGVALAFGLLPALHASRQDLRDNMQESSGSTGSPYARRLLGGLVVVEVALALVLLVGAGLMTRSFTKLLQVSPGFDSNNLVAARVLLPTTKYQRATQVRFYEDVLERVKREPGVINASAVSAMPLHDVGAAGALPFNVEGQPPPPTEDPMADVRIVAPGYFETMKIKLLAGRFLDERDAQTVRARASSTRRWRGGISRTRARSAASSRIRTARAKSSASSATCTTRVSIAIRRSRCICR